MVNINYLVGKQMTVVYKNDNISVLVSGILEGADGRGDYAINNDGYLPIVFNGKAVVDVIDNEIILK